VLLGVSHRWGAGVSPDSVAYLDAAHNFRHGNGLMLTADQPLLYSLTHEHAPSQLLLWAPLYPVVLAATTFGPLELEEAVRLLNAILLAATVALIAWLVLRVTRSGTAAVLAAGAVGFSPVALDLYSQALSEPLFVLLSYVGIALVACYLSAERPVYLLGAAFVTGLALLARFAGVPLVAATALPILLYSPGGWRTRLGRAVLFTAVGLLPLFAWLARNWHLTGSATGRQLGWHPVSANRLAHGVDEFTMLMVPSDVPAVLRGPLALATFVAVAAVATRIRSSQLSKGFGYYTIVALAVYLMLYPVFLVGSISFADAVTNLSHRFLFPVYPGMVILASWVLVVAFRSCPVRSVRRRAIVGGVTVFLCGSVIGLVVAGQRICRDGDGYRGRIWAESPSIARIRTLPESTTLHSDRPEAIYFLTGRIAQSIPATSNPMTGRPNRSLAAENRELRRQITRRDVFVLFSADYRSYLEAPERLEKEVGLTPTFRTTDARFLRRHAD
jgi:hypothetical protein